jgi:taurine dioxygenase
MPNQASPALQPLLIEGVDCRGFDPADIRRFRQSVFDHKVVVLRGQQLDAGDFAAFVRRLGPTIAHTLEQHSLPGLRDILRITNLYDDAGRPLGVHDGGTYWHTDMSYLAQPDVFTSLYAVATPPMGGQTLFVDCEAALDALAAEGLLAAALGAADPEDIIVRHRFGNRDLYRNDGAATQTLTPDQSASLPVEVLHPLLRHHKVVDRVALYGIAGTSFAIQGWPQDHSRTVLDGLFDLLLGQATPYAHHYRKGDLVIWDNALTLHRGVALPPTTDPANCRMLYRANIAY